MPLQVEGNGIQVLGPMGSSNFMGSMRRVRELSEISPQHGLKSGLCSMADMEGSRRGSIKIQHVTGLSNFTEGRSRFPKLNECAHFHYEHVEIGPLQVSIVDEDDLKSLSSESESGKWWSLSVMSQNKTWLIRRSYENFRMLDEQLHRCIYDRKFSELPVLPAQCIEEQENIHQVLSDYMKRFSAITGNVINCGPILNWLELDNRGHRLLVPDNDNCLINTPAVAAAYSVKRYTAQASDEISFEVGDMISVIDMPPPEESIWWRGKRGFEVGFFPCECVAVIGDKIPRNLKLSSETSKPMKPVLRKHGKLISFFRSFILSRPSRRRLKQSGILKERVFGCDLGEHLLNSGHEIPMVLKCCVEFIESHGLIDGIYRLSGVTSNIQKLRNAFDEDRVPAIYEDEAILQDVHSVASLLKMYFRELPNPLCTYQLYHQFVRATQVSEGGDNRLIKMRDVVRKLPPPHYRTLEYLMRHLARVSEKGPETGMTSRNVAIVWAPNLLRCKELEVGGVAALQGVGVQAVVTEFLVCYADLIFCDRLPNFSSPPQQVSAKKNRPKSLAISTPTKLLSLEEARSRALLQSGNKGEPGYIEVGGGPANLPAKYHTIIELPACSRKRLGSKRSPIGWKMLFGKSGRSSQTRKETDKPQTARELSILVGKAVTELDVTHTRRRLRPAKSAESLNSSRNSTTFDFRDSLKREVTSLGDSLSPILLRSCEGKGNGHNRSASHESYFDHLQEQKVEANATLDISEIQVNFDLEESEMGIFSEDETLKSGESDSLTSNTSPRVLCARKIGKLTMGCSSKRLSCPKLMNIECGVDNTQNTDPSPKKQKTNDENLPRSKLEEQLSSTGDIQFIDSLSPEQGMSEIDVRPIQSPSPVSSISQISSSLLAPSSPILPHIPHLNTTVLESSNSETEYMGVRCDLTTPDIQPNSLRNSLTTTIGSFVNIPSLAEVVVSENECLSMDSSELSTPKTPDCLSYVPLVNVDVSSLSTSPDLENDRKLISTETDSKIQEMDSVVNSRFDCSNNIDERKETKVCELLDTVSCYQTVTSEMFKPSTLQRELAQPIPEERKLKATHPYVNISIVNPVLGNKLTSYDVSDRTNTPHTAVDIITRECITAGTSDSFIGGSIELQDVVSGIDSSLKETDLNVCKNSMRSPVVNNKNSENVITLVTVDSLKGGQGEVKSAVDLKSKEHCEGLLDVRFSIDESTRKVDFSGNKDLSHVIESTCCQLSGIVLPKANKESDETRDLEFVDCESVKNSLLDKGILETDLDADIFGKSNIMTEKMSVKPTPKKRMFPQKSNSNGNVQQLLSKFESSSVEKGSGDLNVEDPILNKPHRAKVSSNKENIKGSERPKTLERLSTRRRTEFDLCDLPKVKLEKSKSGSHIDEKKMKNGGKEDRAFLEFDVDLADSQRRERIEKYKEKRRNYLREKYKSESFKIDKDDIIEKNKLVSSDRSEVGLTENSDYLEEKKFYGKAKEKDTQCKPTKDSPNRDLSRKLFSTEVLGRQNSPTTSCSFRDNLYKRNNLTTFSGELKKSTESRFAKSSTQETNFLDFSFGSSKENQCQSSEFTETKPTRRMTDPSKLSRKQERVKSENVPGSRKSLNDGKEESPSTPFPCAKDMTTLFEQRSHSKMAKQYLSSV